MPKKPKISIIIPCRNIDKYCAETLNYCRKLDYGNFEIILLPDEPISKKIKRVKVIPTGKIKPSTKRNLGVEKAKGEIIAFIDADAYPIKKWLTNSIKYFKNPQIGIVGGPNLTPKEDSISQKASGEILASPLGGGRFSIRYLIRKGKFVKELPTCNLLIRKSLFDKIGGFDDTLLTAEDSKICFEARKLGKKVLYAGDVIVFHHRRKLFWPHIKQMWIYGRDKAWLVKEFFSFDKLYYFLPSLWVLFLIFGGFASYFSPLIKMAYFSIVFIYLLAMLFSTIITTIKRSPLVFPGIILTHISYGLGFIYGLMINREIPKK